MNFTFDPTISVAVVITLGNMLFTWYRTRDRNIEARFKDGSKRMAELELENTQIKSELKSFEQQIAALPRQSEMHGLQLLLSEMGGDMKAMRATMKSMAESQGRLETIVTRHEDYLREN